MPEVADFPPLSGVKFLATVLSEPVFATFCYQKVEESCLQLASKLARITRAPLTKASEKETRLRSFRATAGKKLLLID